MKASETTIVITENHMALILDPRDLRDRVSGGAPPTEYVDYGKQLVLRGGEAKIVWEVHRPHGKAEMSDDLPVLP